MSHVIAHEWLTENSLRSYPFSEDATCVSLEGVEVPAGVLADLWLAVPPTVEYPCYVSQISFTGRLLSFVIRDSLGEFLAATTADIQTSPGEYLTVALKTPSAHLRGSLVLDPSRTQLGTILPIGTITFDAAGGKLESSTCIPFENGPVTSLGVWGNSLLFRGDVKLIPGRNISLAYNETSNSIVISLHVAAQYEDAFKPVCNRACVPGECIRPPITHINGVTGTDGDCAFTIDGSGIVEVTTSNGAILIGSETVRPEDLCRNYTRAPDGKPGPPGPPGPNGIDGRLICGVADCDCLLCDVEAGLPPDSQTARSPARKFGDGPRAPFIP